MGTYQIAIVAKALKVPFYVAVESYKFARMYPLSQRDLVDICTSDTYDCNELLLTKPKNYDQEVFSCNKTDDTSTLTSSLLHDTLVETKKNRSMSLIDHSNKSFQQQSCFQYLNGTIDFTPAEYLTLLFTDLGVLTPAAVSDELIRLYQ